MEKFIQSIHNIHPLSQLDLETLLKEGEEIHVSKGMCIVNEGEIDSSVYLLKKGVWRGFHSYEEREATFWFVIPGEAAFSSWGYVDGKPSQLTIEASSDSVALKFSKESIEHLFMKSESLAIWIRKMLEKLLLSIDQWMVDFSKPTATERYSSFADKMPEILQNVPLKDIAGFLNMTPQSLSRIRAQLVKKN